MDEQTNGATDSPVQQERPASPEEELKAMGDVMAALKPVDRTTKIRVLRWAQERLGAPPAPMTPQNFGAPGRVMLAPSPAGAAPAAIGAGGLTGAYDALPDFFHAIAPTTQPEKALVVGTWLQERDGEKDFDAQTVNTHLKNLGHGIADITGAFDALMARNPKLVIQTRKEGTTKQARKKFKVTHEGLREVQRMQAKAAGGETTILA